MPYRIEWEFKPKKDQQYILCANHFSYLDIPSMGLISIPFKFIGKSSLTTIPLFGFMYNRLHITVNRSSLKSKKESLTKSRKAAKDGFNLAFFPEGGIVTPSPPKMSPFKDGAFVLASEQQIPILPIVFLDNFKILPDDNQFLLKRRCCRIKILSPIFPKSSDKSCMEELKSITYAQIQSEIDHSI